MTERLARVAHLFPLVPRPQPARPPVHQRISEITQLAATSPDHPDHASHLAAAHNKAALIASDFGDAEFARTLCWGHHDRYADQRPWDAATARRALEPLVNLARLQILDRRPDAAVAVLESLLHATRSAGTAHVDRRPVHLRHNVLISPDARREVHRWLWTVVVAEGIRALARADRWDDALAHAQAHHGIGDTLLDGRQTAVIAHALHGELDDARKILDTSVVHAPWQRAVHACLELATQECAEPAETRSEATFRLIKSCYAEPLRFRTHLIRAATDDLSRTSCASDDKLANPQHQGVRDLSEPLRITQTGNCTRTYKSANLRELLCSALDKPARQRRRPTH